MNTLINPLRDSGQQSLGIAEANRASLHEIQTGERAEREAAGRGKGDFKSRTNPSILERREAIKGVVVPGIGSGKLPPHHISPFTN